MNIRKFAVPVVLICTFAVCASAQGTKVAGPEGSKMESGKILEYIFSGNKSAAKADTATTTNFDWSALRHAGRENKMIQLGQETGRAAQKAGKAITRANTVAPSATPIILGREGKAMQLGQQTGPTAANALSNMADTASKIAAETAKNFSKGTWGREGKAMQVFDNSSSLDSALEKANKQAQEKSKRLIGPQK